MPDVCYFCWQQFKLLNCYIDYILEVSKEQACDNTVKPVYNGDSQKDRKLFQNQLTLNTGQTYCRMLQGEQSAIHLTFIKLLFVIKIFVLPIFEWPFYTGFRLKGLSIDEMVGA